MIYSTQVADEKTKQGRAANSAEGTVPMTTPLDEKYSPVLYLRKGVALHTLENKGGSQK